MKAKQTYNAVIIDDNEDNASLLNHLLTRYCSEVKVLKVFNEPLQALENIPVLEPDLIFLDIDMPGLSGFELLDTLPDGFAEKVVFVTGHKDYAIPAIKKGIFDYMLKPVSVQSLRETLKRFIARQEKARQQSSIQQTMPAASPNRQILINRHDKAFLLNLDEVNYIEAQGPYTRIMCKKNYVINVSKPISYFKDLLEQHTQFLLANQSYLINSLNIKEIEKEVGRDAVLTFTDETSLLLMRRTKDNLIKLIRELEKR